MGEMDDAAAQGDSGAAAGGSTDEDDQMNDFVNSGRTGRRNAVPEVDTHGIDPDAVKLAERLSSMNTATGDHLASSNSAPMSTTGGKDDNE